MLDLESGRESGVQLKTRARGVELCFFEALPRAKLRGLNYSVSESPSVVVGGRKQPVVGVY